MSVPGLPPTHIEELIESAVLQVAQEILGAPLTVRQKRKVENLRVRVACICGSPYPIGFMHQCLYCQQWLCVDCAEKHFGQSRREYAIEKLRETAARCAAYKPTSGRLPEMKMKKKRKR